ncbi:hypothetical protein FXO38_10583 [Capsicum annuum]|nr:hypothetical protein FXO37_25182 [Capsicum annuum]KAF3663534.1 hypothetical protein FXO38_10583 [Capsicum annuum]
MPFFLTLRSVQTLSDPKVVDGIKMELFGATTIKRKIILKGGLVAVDVGSGSGSGAAVDVTVEATAEEHNVTVDNPSNSFKEKEKVEPVSSGERKNYSDCDLFIAAYAEYLSDGLQVPNDGLDAGLLRKRYAALLWKYGEAKAQKPYTNDIKDPRRPKPNSVAPDEK